MNERRRFMGDYASGQWTMTELCERYGISRKTGYARVERVRREGEAGLEDRSRAPRGCPHRTGEAVEELIVAERKGVHWGARKLLRVLSQRRPRLTWPARSTISDILKRNGLVKARRGRRKWEHPGAPKAEASEPNALWTTDFKGQFRTGDGRYCYPLTIVDLHSRYLLGVTGLPNVRTESAKPVFERLFREVGMPWAIRSDNGAPFASTGIHGLCELNTWWMRLGIAHQRITPASPQGNGAHERMHRTLKRDTARPPKANMGAQQRRFDDFASVQPRAAARGAERRDAGVDLGPVMASVSEPDTWPRVPRALRGETGVERRDDPAWRKGDLHQPGADERECGTGRDRGRAVEHRVLHDALRPL